MTESLPPQYKNKLQPECSSFSPKESLLCLLHVNPVWVLMCGSTSALKHRVRIWLRTRPRLKGKESSRRTKGKCWSHLALLACVLSSPLKLFHYVERSQTICQLCVFSRESEKCKSEWQREQGSGRRWEKEKRLEKVLNLLVDETERGRTFVCKASLWHISIQWLVTLHCVLSSINQTACLQRRSAAGPQVIADAGHTTRPLWLIHGRFGLYVPSRQSELLLCAHHIHGNISMKSIWLIIANQPTIKLDLAEMNSVLHDQVCYGSHHKLKMNTVKITKGVCKSTGLIMSALVT